MNSGGKMKYNSDYQKYGDTVKELKESRRYQQCLLNLLPDLANPFPVRQNKCVQSCIELMQRRLPYMQVPLADGQSEILGTLEVN